MSLGTLTHLLTSHTIASVIAHPIKTRGLHWLTIALCLFWALSPIGSQASLRLVSARVRTINSAQPISWLDRSSSSLGFYFGKVGNTRDFTLSRSLFTAAFLTSRDVQNSSVDTWGNIKLPVLENTPNAGSWDDWTELPDSVTYSSLVGFPVSAGAMEGNTSFVLENVTYWYSTCYNVSNSTLPSPNSADYRTWLPLNDYSGWGTNAWAGTWQIAFEPDLVQTVDFWNSGSTPVDTPFAPGNPLDEFASSYAQLTPGGGPMKFVFEQYNPVADMRTHFDCLLTTSAIDLSVDCSESSGCSSRSARYTPNTHRPNVFWGTNSDFGQFDEGFVSNFAQTLPAPTGSSSSMFASYLQDPLDASSYNVDHWVNLTNVAPQIVGQRLGQLLNTFWLAMSPIPILSASLSGARVLSASSPAIFDPSQDRLKEKNGTMTVYTTEEYLHCDKSWLSALFFATLVLLFPTICSPWLRMITVGPDTLDLISALTRVNDITVPATGSHLDGDKRSRLMRDLRV